MTSIAGAPFLASPRLQRILAVLNPAEGRGETRIVGGAVRNTLMGRSVSDVDLATVFVPDEVTRLASGAGLHVVPTGLRFGTVTVVADGEAHEVTTLRRDVATDGRWAEVAFGTDWAEDAERRDLTINALYADPDGAVYDPLGALPDVMTRRVRFIGDPDARIREDHLRALRFFRFHAQYAEGPIDGAGFRAAVRARPLMGRLSPERIHQELMKLLRAGGASETLAALAETGILSDIVGAPELGRFARLAALEAALRLEAKATRRLAALAVRIEEDAVRLGARLRLSNREAEELAAIGREAARLAAQPDARAGRRALYASRQHYGSIVLVAWTIAGAGTASPAFTQLAGLAQADPVPEFPLRGADLVALGLAPGPEVGRVLARIEADWIAGDFRQGREALLDQAKRRVSAGEGAL